MFRVLLVDDEDLILISLRYSFPWKTYGFTDVISTNDANHALRILKEQRIDVAFVDIRMPSMTGLELIAAARQERIDTDFVIVSGYADFFYAKKAIELSVVDYCLKPVDVEETAHILEKLVDKVYSRRIVSDSDFIHNLLSDASICEKYLLGLWQDNSLGEDLTLMYLRYMDSTKIFTVLREFEYTPILFGEKNELFLIWKKFSMADKFVESVGDCHQELILICSVSSINAISFQNVLKKLRVECHNRRTDTGVVRLSLVCPEMMDYFNEILSYIDKNYNQKITLRNLADEYGVNYTYLSQLFKKTVGVSFPEYMTNIRLQHASHLISKTEMKIVNIAEYVGFTDYHYFCKVFKQRFSMSPIQYRNGSRKDEKI